MNPYVIGQLSGLVLMVVCLVAGWRGVPFKWAALAAATLLAAALALSAGTYAVIGVLGLLFWYGAARGARRLFGGRSGYAR